MAGGWSAQQLIRMWGLASGDTYADPLAEVRSLGGFGGKAVRSEVLCLAATEYVETTAGFRIARPALRWRYELGLDLGDFPALGSGQTLLRSLMEYGWADLIYLPKAQIPRIAEYRFWWLLNIRLQEDPPTGDLAKAFEFAWAQELLSGPVTQAEHDQAAVLKSLDRAIRRGDTEGIRCLRARLETLRRVVI